jgi:predicted SprT family Zn-dependent metalloprotease
MKKKKSIVPSIGEAITGNEYAGLDTAKNFFNQELWNGSLPDCLLSYQRKGNSRGYFHKANFHSRSGAARIDEIALNPDAFHGRTDEEIVSVLVHELAHQWRYQQDEPPTPGYHDRVWSREMFRIGLCASKTGAPGGSPNGYQMDHYIVDSGLFKKAWKKLEATGFKINWESPAPTKTQKKKTESKTKYSCKCGLNVWGKPGIVDLKHGTHPPMEAKKGKEKP